MAMENGLNRCKIPKSTFSTFWPFLGKTRKLKNAIPGPVRPNFDYRSGRDIFLYKKRKVQEVSMESVLQII